MLRPFVEQVRHWYSDTKYNCYLRYKYAWLGLRQSAYFEACRRDGLNRWSKPWFNLAACEFLDRLIVAEDRVLEYGSGNGTLWLADRCRSVTSVESDPAFADTFFGESIPDNVDLRCRVPPTSDPAGNIHDCATLVEAASRWAEHPYMEPLREGPYDVIVVDGRARALVLTMALDALRPGGFIVFDNLDRCRYEAAVELLHQRSALLIPIRGMAPFNDIEMETGFVFLDPARLQHLPIPSRDY